MKPLATFVLYAYNEEKFIREAIESAFAQTYSPLEIVLSDDGSTDRTFEIMQEMAAAYKGPHKIILNRNEKNIGIGSQLNAAAAMTNGEFVVLANGDDISLPIRVERIVHEWESHGRTATAVWSEIAIVVPSGQ
jgi:glycosyltransferase involved in cell wall biosynthesis